MHNGQARTLDEVTRLHDEYVEITRRVAAAQRAPLLDLRTILSGDADAGLFQEDGIHFRAPGRRRIAAEICKALCEVVKTDEWRSRKTQ